MVLVQGLSSGSASILQSGFPPDHDEGSTVNVLVTGECQQGKRTLIRQFARYAKIPNLQIGIGSGSVRCTTEVANYDMAVTLREYQLIDSNNQIIANRQYSDLVELRPEQARVVEIQSATAPGHRFRFIDTPGMNDTFGEDFSIMSRILSRAADLGHINALVYVRDVESGFGSSFQRFFNYIRKSMPSLCNGLIIVHSRYTVDRVEELLDENQRLDEIRRQAFQATAHLELQHFFMDNDPAPTSPFAVLQSLNEVYRLLLHISSQRPLPVQNVKLLKTEVMRHLDIHVINTLGGLARKLEKEWSLEKSHADILKANVMSAQEEITKLKNRIRTNEKQVQELGSDDEVLLGTKSCVVPYSFVGHLLLQGQLNLGTCPLRYDSDHVISSVEKSCSNGSEWLSEELRGTSWRASITSKLFRDINGSATFYSTSALMHKREVNALQGIIRDLQDRLVVQEQNLARNAGTEGPDARLAQLSNDKARVDELIEIIQSDAFDMTLWEQLRAFYDTRTFPTAGQIQSYVQTYDSTISRLL